MYDNKYSCVAEVKIIKPEMLKMPLSLDERLNIEFGLTPKPVKENGELSSVP